MNGYVRNITDKNVPDEYRFVLNIKLLRGLSIFALLSEFIMLIISWVDRLSWYVPLFFMVVYAINFFVLLNVKRYYLAANLFLGAGCANIILSIIVFGGLRSTAVLWLPLLCIVPFYLGGRYIGAFWSLACFVLFPLTGWISTKYSLYTKLFTYDEYIPIALITILLVSGAISVFAILFINSRNDVVKKIADEKSLANKLTLDKRLLISTICHDIANPLTIIGGFERVLHTELQKLADRTGDAQMLKLVDYLQQQGNAIEKISNIISRVKLLEALELRKITLENQKVNLEEVQQELIPLFQTALETKKIKLVFNWAANVVVADKSSLITGVFSNLISNAIKFSSAGGTIAVCSINESVDWVRIDIKDEGIGIPANLEKKVFSMTEKTSRSGTAGEQGIGFGLPLVKYHVELYGGRIELVSNCNKEKGPIGTTFSVFLLSGVSAAHVCTTD